MTVEKEWVETESVERSPLLTRRLAKAAINLTGMAAATATVLGMYEYQSDVNSVKEMLAHTQPYIIENSDVPMVDSLPLSVPRGVYESMEAPERRSINDSRHLARLAVVNMPGFGLVDTYRAGDVLRPFDSIGAIWSVHYDNTGIDTTVIAKTIVAKARTDNIDEIGLYADSMGTIIESEVAVEITRIAPDITIPFIVMDSPAVDLDVLRPKSKRDGFALLDGMNIPGAQYSRYARLLAELYLHKDSLQKDPTSFPAVFNETYKQVFNSSDLPANTLLAEQFQMIINADIEGDLATLGSLPEGSQPIIVFMGAENAKADDVVNTPRSYSLLRKWTEKADLSLLGPYGIKDFYHGAQWRSVQEYRSVLGKQVVPEIIDAREDSLVESLTD